MSRASDILLEDGSVAVVKTAHGTAAASDLSREGERLQAAAHPGVVEVVQSWGDEQRWELRLLHGGRPVNLLHPAPPTRIAQVTGAAAEVLADLHDRGIVHGRLRSHHVLVGPGGRVQLCGFGPGLPGAAPADDVAALGSLIVELLGDREDLEPLPDVRWHRRRPWPGVTRRSLLALADAACAEPASRRPTARRLASAIFEAVPEARGIGSAAHPARLAGRRRRQVGDGPGGAPVRAFSARAVHDPSDGRDVVPPGVARRRIPRIAPVPAVLATLGVGLLVLAVARPGPAPEVVGVAAPERGASPCAVLEPAPAGGTCLGPVRVDGTVVIVGNDRFQVGGSGDEIVVGDWDCDGAVTPALLRRSTGEVFVFRGWATNGDLRVTPEVVVPQASGFVVPRGCGAPVVERVDGSTHTVEVGGGAA